MKKNYIKPQIVTRNTQIKNYILSNSDGKIEGQKYEVTGMLKDMLTKERDTSSEIWGNSDSDDTSIW